MLTGDGYTSEPTRVRICKADPGDEWPWWVDGADDEGNYTQDVRTFRTFEEAVAFVPEFIADNEDVVTWCWRGRRPAAIERAMRRTI